jgi:hypothetical protein
MMTPFPAATPPSALQSSSSSPTVKRAVGVVARQQPDTKIQMSQSLDETDDFDPTFPAGSKENAETLKLN